MTRKRKLTIVIPLAVLVALVALFAAVGVLTRPGMRSDSKAGSGGTGAVAGDSGSASRSLAQAKAAPVPEPAFDSAGHSTTSVAADLPNASAPAGHYLVRNGALTLQVPKGSLLGTVDRITALTTGMGGYVVSSSVGSEPTPWPLAESGDGKSGVPVTSSGDGYAVVTARVPEDRFDIALRRYAALGDVKGVSTSSEDVTSQYVDLQARLDHYRAVERRLVRFLAATTSVPQMLAVQDRIDRVQLTIERLTAELKSLHETTSYGTITLSVSEKGAHHAVAAAGTSLWGTFWHSVLLLGRGARLTGLAIVAILPFVVVLGGLAALGWAASRRFRRRRQAAQPSLPA